MNASEAVSIPLAQGALKADLLVPEQAVGLVIFAHGSGSSRRSSRNRAVARRFQDQGMGTLLFDLLTPEEAVGPRSRELTFGIPLLASRLVEAARWARQQPGLKDLAMGFYGSSTGAAAALVAAAQLQDQVAAVVSRGGRPDLAGGALAAVVSPVLLIVGGEDGTVIPLNEEALGRIRCEKAMRIVLGATHLFEEPGKLEVVSELAAHWFLEHFRRVPAHH